MSQVSKLQELDKLHRGVDKRWIWGSPDNYSLSCDYLRKIDFCIQDLNREIPNLDTDITMKEVVYVIVLADWVCEAVDSIHKILRKEVIDFLNISSSNEVEQPKQFLKAIRSFVVAHPLTTDRHKKYGMDGALICVDIRSHSTMATECCLTNSDWMFLTLDGLHENARDKESDFVLFVYSQKIDQMKYFKYIRGDFSDLYYVAQLQIERLYALDSQLSKLTRKKVGIL